MFNLPFLHPRVKDTSKKILIINGEPVCMVIGLGNPGKKYEHTYHNVGFLFLDGLREYISAPSWRDERNFQYTKIGKLIFVKPKVFMNNSGEAVQRAIRKFNIDPSEILIVHDESDIVLGSQKLSRGRGPAGHNGVASVIQNLKTSDFQRLRIGVRTNNTKAGGFVLKKIKGGERELLDALFLEIWGNYFEAYRK